jgi:hypothetical protein
MHSEKCDYIILTPNLPNTNCGLGDYSALLSSIVENNLKARCVKIISAQTERAKFKSHLRSKEIHNAIVILNFSPWGYNKWGVPIWLLSLVFLSRKKHNFNLITIFHELWSSTYVDRPKFHQKLIDKAQKFLIRQLLLLSDKAITTTEEKYRHLLTLADSKNISLIGVPSNIKRSPLAHHTRNDTKLTISLFGKVETRALAISNSTDLLKHLEAQGLIGEIKIIGLHPEETTTRLLNLKIPEARINEMGFLENSEVGSALAESDLFLSPYTFKDIGKSGTIQAAITNGAVPIIQSSKNKVQIVFENDHHYPYDTITRTWINHLKLKLLKSRTSISFERAILQILND